VAEAGPDPEVDPLAQLADRAQEYAGVWRSAIERNAAGTYKPEDWFDDVNRTWVMAAQDAARAFAMVVDAVSARTSEPETSAPDDEEPSPDG
jgi:hypothetical protein